MNVRQGTLTRPVYWVMEDPFESFDQAHREARAVADHRESPVAVRATWSGGNYGNGIHHVRVACMVEPTSVIEGRLV